MNTLELLIAARKKIEKPECWTKRRFAADSSGRDTHHNSPEAVCWCGQGALWALTQSQVVMQDAAEVLNQACGSYYVEWQDAPERTHDEVLACFSRAIESERQKAAAASNQKGGFT